MNSFCKTIVVYKDGYERENIFYLIMFFAFENLITFIKHNPNHLCIIHKVKHRTMMNGSNLKLFDVKHTHTHI
jgi:hypothetical protein